MELCKLCDTFVPEGDTYPVTVHNGTVVEVCHDCSYQLFQMVAAVVDPD